MKKLFLFAIAFCLAITVTKPICADEEGNLFAVADRGWFYLKNSGTTTIYDGQIVYYASVSTANTGEDVILGSPATTLVAGVAMDNIAPDKVGRVQVRGYHSHVLCPGGAVAGAEMIPSGYTLVPNDGTTTSIYPRFVCLQTKEVGNQGDGASSIVSSAGSSGSTIECMINLR